MIHHDSLKRLCDSANIIMTVTLLDDMHEDQPFEELLEKAEAGDPRAKSRVSAWKHICNIWNNIKIMNIVILWNDTAM